MDQVSPFYLGVVHTETPLQLHIGQRVMIGRAPYLVTDVFDSHTFEAIEVDQSNAYRQCGPMAYGKRAPV